MIFIILSWQFKSTIQKHSGDLEAAESACAELHMEMEEEPSTDHSSTTSTTRKGGGGQDSDILETLQKRVAESGSILKGLSKQQQPMTARTAFANYVRDSLLTMSKADYKKARSTINKVLSELMDDSGDDNMSLATQPALSVSATQQELHMQAPVRPSSAPSFGSDQYMWGSQWSQSSYS